ncbi:MAG: 4-hydroxyphenylpyruvate dioxygenase [Polyangiaceae bacterium]|jgi:4-hydroxyphenylpyruvate dioxygenase|nr:4-hydroxyphenylpyruvate dioxygenase [Polyangiaceae bacterium]
MGHGYQLLGTHHVELCVGNAKQAAYYYQKAWGFEFVAYQGLETGHRNRISYVLKQNQIRLVLTSPLGPGGPLNAYLDRHGDGVRDIAFITTDAEAAFASTTSRGAEPIQKPTELRDESGSAVVATIRAYADVRHTFVQSEGYGAPHLPGFRAPVGLVQRVEPTGLRYIDHVVNNTSVGDMEKTVRWYQDVFGFHRFWSADDKDIRTEHSSLASIVVANDNERIKMPVNEPAPGLRKSQIQEYLDYNIDAGVQHLAMRTDDIITTVRKLRDNGVEFLEVPDAYYEGLRERVGDIREPTEALREHGILVDRDEQGYLLQLFTMPVQNRPTLFYEIIQREGSESFGKGNFKALFESIEREQARRGNL